MKCALAAAVACGKPSPWQPVPDRYRLHTAQVHADKEMECMALVVRQNLAVTLAECVGTDASRLKVVAHSLSGARLAPKAGPHIRDNLLDVATVERDPSWKQESPKENNLAYLVLKGGGEETPSAGIPAEQDYTKAAVFVAVRYTSTTEARFPQKRGEIRGRNYTLANKDVCKNALQRNLGSDEYCLQPKDESPSDEYCLEPKDESASDYHLRRTERGAPVFFTDPAATKVAGIVSDTAVYGETQVVVIENIHRTLARKTIQFLLGTRT